MPITLPASPTLNQRYTYSGSTYQWNGTVWNVIESTTSNSIGPTGPTGPIGTSQIYSPIVIKLAAGDADYTGTATVSVPAGTYYVNQSFNNSQIIIGGQTITGNGTLTLSSPATSATIIAGGDKVWTQALKTTYDAKTIDSIAYGAGLYVAVSGGGTAYTSTDAITWTTRAAGTGSSLSSVFYTGSKFVSVGYTQSTTSTNGITWSQGGTFANTMYAVTYGNGIYVAAGSSNSVYSSTDGVTWTVRTSGRSGGGNFLSAAYVNNRFVIGDWYGISSSTDGITWTAGANISGVSNIWDIAYGNGLYAIARSYGMSMSTDLITWTNVSLSSGYYTRCIFYENGYFYVGGESARIHKVLATTSSTNVNIIGVGLGNGDSVSDIVYGGGKYVLGTFTGIGKFASSLTLEGKNKYDNYVVLSALETI
jgi:hypothetical protein